MVTLCQHCGADLSHHASFYPEAPGVLRCFDCGLASGDGGAWQPRFEPDDEVHYELEDWTPAQRVALALTLYDVPFRWEPGPVLVVRAEGEAIVEDFLEDLRAAGDGAGEAVDPGGLETPDAFDEATGEVETVLGELFVTADRLIHAGWDKALLARMTELAGQVETNPPPFGIERRLWDDIAAGAATVVAAGHLDDEIAVEDAASDLRGLLRDYV